MNEAALFHQIRMLKGARLSILLILQHADRPLTGIELQQATGYTDKPVRTALAWLSRNRMAISAGRQTGWILGPKPPPFLTLSPIAPEMDGQIQPAGLAATTDGAYGRYDPYGEAAAISSATSAPAKERPGIYNQGLDPIEDGAELVAGDYGDRRNSEHPSQDRKNPDLPDRRNSDHDLSDRKKSAFVDRRNSDLAGSDRKNSDRGSENFRSTADLISSDLIDLTDDDDDLHHHHQIRSIKQQIAREKNRDRKKSDLVNLLHKLRIREPAYSRILQYNEADELLAWYWEGRLNNKIENHLGFTINRLEIGEEPDPAFLELARVWLGMSEKKRRLTAQTGSWGNMPSFWYEEVLSDETMIAMTAVLKAEGFKKVF